MALAKTEKEWAERAARHLKAELKRADLTYDELAERLKNTVSRKPKPVLRTSWHDPRSQLLFFLRASQ